MLDPFCPRPTIPSCIDRSSFGYVFFVNARTLYLSLRSRQDKVVGGSIMLQPRIIRSFNLGDDMLASTLPNDAPLMKESKCQMVPWLNTELLIDTPQLAQRFWCEFSTKRTLNDELPSKTRCGTRQCRAPLQPLPAPASSEGQRLSFSKTLAGQQHLMSAADGSRISQDQ